MKTPDLTVRRSRFHAWAVFALATGVACGAVAYALQVFRSADGSMLAPVIIVALLAFYALQSWRQATDREPLLRISNEGIDIPSALPETIPWSAVRDVRATRSFVVLGGGRVDVEVKPEIALRLKLGSRLWGDSIVRMIGLPSSFSVVGQGLDHPARTIYAAIARHWPPPPSDPTEQKAE
jgi:hypothetical protein